MEEDPPVVVEDLAPSSEARGDQSRRFWALECEMRTRCTLTSTEMMQLEAVSRLLATKVKENPLSHVNHVPRVWLWQQLLDLSKDGVLELNGSTLSQQTPEWTLAKVCLLQKRRQDRMNGHEVFQCHCLPATAFMPSGCSHIQTSLGSGYHDCPQCSLCLRCGQLCKRHGKAGNMCICTSAALSPECEDDFLH